MGPEAAKQLFAGRRDVGMTCEVERHLRIVFNKIWLILHGYKSQNSRVDIFLPNVVETLPSDRAVQEGNGLIKKKGLWSVSLEDFNHTPGAHLMKNWEKNLEISLVTGLDDPEDSFLSQKSKKTQVKRI